jgi:ankyrin repeat protein
MGNTISCSCQGPLGRDPRVLVHSAEAGALSAVAAIVAAHPQQLVNSTVFGCNTAWHKAAKAGHVAVLEELAAAVARHWAAAQCASAGAATPKAGGDVQRSLPGSCPPHSTDRSRQRTCPLMHLGSTAEAIVTRLINRGNAKGSTPLMLASSGGHTDAVSWLLKHGALRSVLCDGSRS